MINLVTCNAFRGIFVGAVERQCPSPRKWFSIVRALATRGAKDLLLARDVSNLRGVKTASVDFNDETQVANALKEHTIDAAVISPGSGADAEYVLTVVQVGIARAAKAADVKLFVPSEFGINTEDYALESDFEAKSAARVMIQAIRIPTTRVMTGWFTQIIPWLTSSVAKLAKFVITGKGDRK